MHLMEVYAVEGNHEHYVEYDAWMKVFPTLNMRVLHNSHEVLNVKGASLAIARHNRSDGGPLSPRRTRHC